MKNMTDSNLTLERARQKINYDETTGILTWRINVGTIKAGTVAGNYMGRGYRQVCIDQRAYLVHRLAWFMFHGVWPDGDIDHINGIRDDNRIENLRDVSRSVNMQNQVRPHRENTSGYLGVCFNKNLNKWDARIRFAGVSRYIGSFETAEQAHEAYLFEKRRNHEGCTI